jgi:hypothetical protein
MAFLKFGYLRLPQIIGDRTATPPVPAILPISRSTFLNGVRSGRFPKPIKLSERQLPGGCGHQSATRKIWAVM